MAYTIDSLVSLISHIHSISADFLNKKISKKDSFVSSHGFILFLLSENNKMTMGEIASKINRNKSTTTVLINKLFSKDLIQIEISKEDNRKKIITLTNEGKKYNTITSKISKELLQVCYKDFSDKEKNELLYLLEKMNNNIEKQLKIENILE